MVEPACVSVSVLISVYIKGKHTYDTMRHAIFEYG